MMDNTAGPPTRLLLATDLSPRSDRALDRALLLARAWQARLLALTVLEPHAGGVSPRARAQAQLADEAAQRQAVHRLRADLGLDQGGADLPLAVHVAQGDVVEQVLQRAEAEGSGLIVTGVARHEALSRIVLGSSVDALARRVPVPLLVVRERARRPYAEILVASDFSEASRHALRTAVALFPEARFTLFHAFGNAYPALAGMDAAQSRRAGHDQAEREAEAFVQASGLPQAARDRLRVLLAHGDAGLLLHAHGAQHPGDLVVLGTQRRTGLAGLLLGSVAQRMLELAQNDVLIVPPG